ATRRPLGAQAEGDDPLLRLQPQGRRRPLRARPRRDGRSPETADRLSASLPSLTEAVEVLLRFGAMLLRAGDTAFRVRDSMKKLAERLGVEGLSVQIALD